MGSLRRLSGEEVCRILAAAGFERVRQRGSHRIMQLRTGNTTVTVPVPMKKEVKTGTLMSIVRQSGLDRRLFEAGSGRG